MTQQQIKTKKLLKKMRYLTGENVANIVLAYLMAALMLITSFLPVFWQEESDHINEIIWMISSLFVGFFYLLPYRVYNTIKYLPIDFKDVRYIKFRTLLKIYGLLLPISMLFQFIGCNICNEAFHWTTVLAVLLYSFVFPMICNLFFVFVL